MSTATAEATRNGMQTPDDPFEMEASSSGSFEDFEACPAGTHPGTIVGLFDTGHREKRFKGGDPSVKRLLMIVVELKKKKSDGKPFVLVMEETFSLHEKSNLRGMVHKIMGTKLPDGAKFNIRALLGQPVMASVENSERTKNDKTYTVDKLTALIQMSEEIPAPTPTITPVCWSVATGEPFPSDLKWLPRFYGKTIRELAGESEEAKSRATDDLRERREAKQAANASDDEGDDDIAF